jgi:Tfp pilus assembly protein PilX
MPNQRGTSGRLDARRGVTLPMTLLIIVVLSALAAGAFTRVGSERRTIDNQEATLDAYSMARTGLDQFLADPKNGPFTFDPATFVGPDSGTITLTGGYARIILQRIRPAVGTTVSGLYIVRSRGVKTVSGVSGAPAAERTVALIASWQPGTMNVLAAWTSLTGLTKNGGSGTLSGVVNCGRASTVAGVGVPNSPGYSQNGGSSVPNGSPNILNMGTQAAAASSVGIDWTNILNGASLTPDVTIPGSSWPSSSTFASSWPVIFVDQAGDFSLPADGRGTLVVRNNLTISGSKSWEGIVLVGGTLTANGTNSVRGAVVSGLNVQLGLSPGVSDVGNGTKTYRYDSCNVDSAATRFAGLQPYRNTSVDNWATY